MNTASLGMKREPTYVPMKIRMQLEKLSKADLMEIAYSLALIQSGEEDVAESYQILKREHENLCFAQERKPIKLASTAAEQAIKVPRLAKDYPHW